MIFLPFLQSQKLLSIATQKNGEPWIATVYFGVDEQGNLYFVSPKDSRHCSHIRKQSKIAFSSAWSDEKNSKNRKGIQGTGVCRQVRSPKQTMLGIKALHKKIPEFKKAITLERLRKNAWGSRLWMITPTYIKYWDDALYGDEESEEFYLNT